MSERSCGIGSSQSSGRVNSCTRKSQSIKKHPEPSSARREFRETQHEKEPALGPRQVDLCTQLHCGSPRVPRRGPGKELAYVFTTIQSFGRAKYAQVGCPNLHHYQPLVEPGHSLQLVAPVAPVGVLVLEKLRVPKTPKRIRENRSVLHRLPGAYCFTTLWMAPTASDITAMIFSLYFV